MLVKTFGSAVHGVDALTITIEVTAGKGIKYFIVGLPDNAVKESLKRVESAISLSGFHMPRQKIVVNLAPADIRKEGSAYDLPIAIGILAASGQVATTLIDKFFLMGELSLDGSIQTFRGALPIAIQAKKEGFRGFILPKENSREAGIVNGLEVYGMKTLTEVADFLNGSEGYQPVIVNTEEEFIRAINNYEHDFSDVKGQENIKRALE
ncbi:MAG: ATP-binding protein, partial [Pedobacter sp.]